MTSLSSSNITQRSVHSNVHRTVQRQQYLPSHYSHNAVILLLVLTSAIVGTAVPVASLSLFAAPSVRKRAPSHATTCACANFHSGMKLKYDPDMYAYVHPSIRDVLCMEPENNLLGTGSFKDRVEDEAAELILVDAKTCTFRWALIDEYLEQQRSGDIEKANEPPDETGDSSSISMSSLVTLASQCELAIFQERKNPVNLPSPIRGVLKLIPTSKSSESNEDSGSVLIATLVALNMVEGSIRHIAGKEHGRAPLLKDMIEMIGKSPNLTLPNSLVMVLRSLLLPSVGINLRNLLWHGFLPTIHRRWFALSIVLTMSIDDLGSSSHSTNSISSTSFFDQRNGDSKGDEECLKTLEIMRQHKRLATIIDHGQSILSSSEKLECLEAKLIQSNFVPRSHKELCKVAMKYVHCPVIFASVMGPFIEHTLRIQWCLENQENKFIAEPGTYYVTLDGHGQRNKHHIVLLPFLSESNDKKGIEIQRRNNLVYKLGGPTMALLVDMFASPPGAPNIRASVAHGLFNKYLLEELKIIEGENSEDECQRELKRTSGLDDMTSSMIAIFDILSSENELPEHKLETNVLVASYRPQFSFAASLLKEVDKLIEGLTPFYMFVSDRKYLEHSTDSTRTTMQSKIESNMTKMSQSLDTIIEVRNKIYNSFGVDLSLQFTDEDYFHESSKNLIASECGAAKLLLSELAIASTSSLQDLIYGVSELQCEDGGLPSRRRKQFSEKCAMARLTLDFYSFAAYCALIFIERRCQYSSKNTLRTKILKSSLTGRHHAISDEILFLAVKRTRMVLSTFTTVKMQDRAFKALEQYSVGKAIKAICKDLENSKCVDG